MDMSIPTKYVRAFNDLTIHHSFIDEIDGIYSLAAIDPKITLINNLSIFTIPAEYDEDISPDGMLRYFVIIS